jgi:hypothetical protein
MIFARDLSDPLASLAKKIDAATDKNSECKMGSFIVFLNDDEGIDQKLRIWPRKNTSPRFPWPP